MEGCASGAHNTSLGETDFVRKFEGNPLLLIMGTTKRSIPTSRPTLECAELLLQQQCDSKESRCDRHVYFVHARTFQFNRILSRSRRFLTATTRASLSTASRES